MTSRKIFERTAQDKDLIRLAVKVWMHAHPERLKVFVKKIEETRKGLTDTNVGMSKKGNMRIALEVPMDLMIKIRNIAPDFLQNKKSMRWLMQEFPIFRVPRKV